LREQHQIRINELRSELTKKLNEERAAWTSERQAKQGELDARRDQLTSATALLNDERAAWANERAAWASERQTKQGELDACRDKLATMEAEIKGLKSRGVQGSAGQPIQEEIFHDAHMY
jgi:chromosome segregation ATPase